MKKKLTSYAFYFVKRHKRSFMIMRNLLLFFLFFSIQAFSGTLSQNRISVELENSSIKELFKVIKEQTSLGFIYDEAYIKNLKNISVNAKNKTVEEILSEILKDTGLEYSIEHNTILITPKVSAPQIQEEKKRKKIDGIVLDEYGDPLPGANVIIKENMQGLITNERGEFSLVVPEDAHLLVSFIGFKTAEVAVTGQEKLEIRMVLSINSLDEVVVINTGYQNISKERSTGSAVSIGAEDLKKVPSLNVVNSLESMVSGMQVSILSGDRTFAYRNTQKSPLSGTHTVGATEYNVVIRGQGTLTGERFPLLVVDGAITEMDISTINPEDIENITILKDAAAASIWGVRAANGVIVVTTKKGKKDQAPQIHFSTNLMIAEKPDLSYLKTMNSAQQLSYEKELVDRGFLKQVDASSYYTAQYTLSRGSQLAWQLKSGAISAEEYDTKAGELSRIDNQSQISKYLLQRATSQNYNISVNGGAEKSSYYYSGSYSRENPNEVRTSGERYTITVNNTWKLFDKVSLSTSFKGTFFRFNNNGLSIRSLYDPSRTTLMPYDLLADENGNGINYDRYDPNWVNSLGPAYKDWTYNYLDELKNNDNTRKSDNYLATIDLNIPILKGLTASLKYDREKANARSRIYHNQNTYYFRNMVNYYTHPSANANSLGITSGGILSETVNNEDNYSLRGQLDYNRRFNEIHQITALAGTEIRETNIGQSSFSLFGYNPDTGLTNSRINFSNTTPTYSYVAGATADSYTTFTAGGYPSRVDRRRRFLSYYSNFAYDYKSRYYISGSVRYDDYNNFGVDRKYRATPLWSTGLKWMVSRENFMSNLEWISSLGIRATYGVNGNLSFDTYPFTYIAFLESDGATGLEYASIISTANPELKWEKVYITNLGLDFGIFENRVSGSFAYYQKNSKDLLYGYPIGSAYVGNINNGSLVRNIASMKSKGLEIGLDSKLYEDRNWNWGMHWSLSYNTNEITDSRFREESYASSYGAYPEGIGYIKGYPTDKLLVYRYAGLDENGLTQIYDENGDIIPATTSTISSFEVFKNAGRKTAPYFGSWNTNLRFKQFSLFALVTYQFGSIFLKPSINEYITSPYRVNYDLNSDIGKRWQQPGNEQTTNVPGLNGGAADVFYSYMRYRYSDINVLKGDYIRLRQVTFSYDLPSHLIDKVHIKSAQVGLTVQNLGLIWTANKEGYDPDFVSSLGYTYSLPAAKSFLFSLNVNF
jgi:TonB-linked SusC/RagA family outer membrane protein